MPPFQRDFYLSKLKSPGLWKHSQCPGLAEKPCEVGNAVCAFQWLQLLRVQWGVGSIGCGIIWFEQLMWVWAQRHGRSRGSADVCLMVGLALV